MIRMFSKSQLTGEQTQALGPDRLGHRPGRIETRRDVGKHQLFGSGFAGDRAGRAPAPGHHVAIRIRHRVGHAAHCGGHESLRTHPDRPGKRQELRKREQSGGIAGDGERLAIAAPQHLRPGAGQVRPATAAEEEAAEFVQKEMDKPVAGFIAGTTAPPGKRMGHAGAIIEGGSGTAADKIAALEAAGAVIAPTPTDMGSAMLEAFARAGKR